MRGYVSPVVSRITTKFTRMMTLQELAVSSAAWTRMHQNPHFFIVKLKKTFTDNA